MKYELREKTVLGFVKIVGTYRTLYAAVKAAEEESKKNNVVQASVSNANRTMVLFYKDGTRVVF